MTSNQNTAEASGDGNSYTFDFGLTADSFESLSVIVDGSSFDLNNIEGLIFGTSGGNVLTGDGDDNRIYALSGNDSVTATLGRDRIYGGDDTDSIDYSAFDGVRVYMNGATHYTVKSSGNYDWFYDVETIRATDGDDLIYGSINADTFYGRDGNDNIQSGASGDTIYGENGNDTIDAGTGDDTIYGGNGNDTIIAGLGDDYIDGGAGLNSLNFAEQSPTGAVTLDLDAGTATFDSGESDTVLNIDRVVATGYDDILYGTDDRQYLLGGDGNDTLYGAGGNDILYGEDGDDTFIGGGGNDNFQGGTGTDTVSYTDNATTGVTVYFDRSTDYATDGQGGADYYSSIEIVEGSNYADFMYGDDSETDTFYGGGGTDTLYGNGGNDSLYGEGGNDSLNGGAGNDTISGGNGNDVMIGGAGTDSYDGGVGATDTINFYIQSGMSNGVDVDLGSGSINDDGYGNTESVTGVERIMATNFDDSFVGSSGTDYFNGYDGADDIQGGGSTDFIYAGDGNDSIRGDGGNDYLQGSGGDDTYYFASGDGSDYIVNNDAVSTNDVVSFDAGIDYDQLWFEQYNNDLHVSVIGTSDRVRISNWYDGAGSGSQVDSFVSGDSYVLDASEVATLVTAMASMSKPLSGQTELTSEQQTDLSAVFASTWETV